MQHAKQYLNPDKEFNIDFYQSIDIGGYYEPHKNNDQRLAGQCYPGHYSACP